MGLKKLFAAYKKYRQHRHEYRIKPAVVCELDTKNYYFVFLPTIEWMPWMYRYVGSCVIAFSWLNFSIGFGIWENR